jgi:hypothetical protein
MSAIGCCLPTPVPTLSPWHRRWRDTLRSRLQHLLAQWRRQRASAACRAALRHLPRHTLVDLGLLECAREEPTLPRVDWEYGRWR